MRPATAALAALIVASVAPAHAGGLLPRIDVALENAQAAEVSYDPLSKHYVEVSPGIFIAVKGMKERRQVRFARWTEGLDGDRLEVYLAEGFPTHRHFESDLGARTEHWSYPARGLTYVFRDGILIDVRVS
jgi:hypothetical protein